MKKITLALTVIAAIFLAACSQRRDNLSASLHLSPTQHGLINNPVGFAAKTE